MSKGVFKENNPSFWNIMPNVYFDNLLFNKFQFVSHTKEMNRAKTIFKLIHLSLFLHVYFLWNNCSIALKVKKKNKIK